MNRLLRFDGRVAVVTGAGGGLGKAYALLLAERGASVVVNDIGSSSHGVGQSHQVADHVVKEIKEKGGDAFANYDSVVNGENIIKAAIDRFGRIDILINNAGILRDKSFAKMNSSDWDDIRQIHLDGAFKTTQSAWNYFRNQSYGRIVMTSSASGLLGQFGQANYAAAKAGLVGLAQTLSKEGDKHNIHTNTIVPLAGSRMTEHVLPSELHNAMKPDLIAPVVCWLCHENCTDNGSIIESCAGVATKYQWFRGAGVNLRSNLDENVTLEAVRENWSKVIGTDLLTGGMVSSTEEMSGIYLQALEKLSSSSSCKLTRNNLSEHSLEDKHFKYDSKDAILYALGVGMSLSDRNGLQYLYENSENFSVLPTFPVIFSLPVLDEIMRMVELNIDHTRLVHAEQYIEFYRAFPSEGSFKFKSKVIDVLDKVTGTLFIIRMEGGDREGPLFMMEFAAFEIGAGKFEGNRTSKKLVSKIIPPPSREPDNVFQFTTSKDQGALYRLSGDRNPLHIDPNFATIGGFSRPILHGLCSFGIAARLILQNYANGDPEQFKAIKVRFSKPVLPGDTLLVETWVERNRIHFEVRIKGSNLVALSGGYVDMKSNDISRIQSNL